MARITQKLVVLGLLHLADAWCPLAGSVSELLKVGAISETSRGITVGTAPSGEPLLELEVAGLGSESPTTAGSAVVEVTASAARLLPLESVLQKALTAAAPRRLLSEGLRLRLMGTRVEAAPAVHYVAMGRGDVEVHVRTDMLEALEESDIEGAAGSMMERVRGSSPQALPDLTGMLAGNIRNGSIPEVLKCVLGCVVPSTFGTLLAENVAAEGLGCLICKAAKLSDAACTSLLEAMFLVPIALEPLSALFVFKVCKPTCPWGKPFALDDPVIASSLLSEMAAVSAAQLLLV